MCSTLARWLVRLAVALAISLPAVAQARGGSGGGGHGGSGQRNTFAFPNRSGFRNYRPAVGRQLYYYGHPLYGYGNSYYACGYSTTAGSAAASVPIIVVEIPPVGSNVASGDPGAPASPQVWHRDDNGTWHEESVRDSGGELPR